MIKQYLSRILWVIGFILVVNSCAVFEEEDYGPSREVDVSDIDNAVPKDEPRSRGGNPDSYVVNGKRYYVRGSAQGYKERGVASWYGYKFHGNKTSNGEVYDMYSMTAAHKTLPLPSYVRVTNLDNGRSIIVRVNDRGPFAKGRIIDLSYVAARKLDIVKNGTGRVEVEAITGADIAQGKGSAMIQIGAFGERSSARKLAQEVANQLNQSVTINEISTSGKQLYRVRIGPFKRQTEVEKWLAELKQLNYRDARVVPEGK